ncbi:MAG: phosphoribosylamine--glycine ligase [Planctomycetes bacterium]|jgi:phosphoribosylamine--glycine ligase|nr:phosphoribosylamine--glycine ligase [Planctomycetota bacterium]
MNVLLIGSGGREHALAWKLMQSDDCDTLYASPGNPGIEADGGQCVSIDVTDHDAVVTFAKTNNCELVVIGPEDPLADGLGDAVGEAGLLCFGPGAKGARIESDKAYAKELMQHVSIPTAEARIFTDLEAAKTYVLSRDHGVAVKAAGLAKGKGVTVCPEPYQAVKVLEDMMNARIFGEAGETVLVEQMLTGQEATVLALVDGRNIYPMEPLQDHKPIGEGDTGANTGGMGAYSPVPIIDGQMMSHIEEEILVPIVDAMRRDFGRYEGVLYAGLMFTPAGPKVIEFNCRFGDPECQPLMMRLKSDLLKLMLATAEHNLDDVEMEFDARPAVCVVMSSGGYPGPYEKGKEITGIESADAIEGVKVFHAGTAMKNGKLVTNGGRVLGVTALGESIADAQERAYGAVTEVQWDGAYWRNDIADKALGES